MDEYERLAVWSPENAIMNGIGIVAVSRLMVLVAGSRPCFFYLFCLCLRTTNVDIWELPSNG